MILLSLLWYYMLHIIWYCIVNMIAAVLKEGWYSWNLKELGWLTLIINTLRSLERLAFFMKRVFAWKLPLGNPKGFIKLMRKNPQGPLGLPSEGFRVGHWVGSRSPSLLRQSEEVTKSCVTSWFFLRLYSLAPCVTWNEYLDQWGFCFFKYEDLDPIISLPVLIF